MTKYKLPDPPASGVVWTRYPATGDVFKWTRHATLELWTREGSDDVHEWFEILGNWSEVFDLHPDFADLPPFPWSVRFGYEIADANGEFVFKVRGYDTSSETDKATARFIVDTINAYVSGVDR